VFLCYTSLFFGFVSLAMIYPFFLIVINDCNNQNEKIIMFGLENFIEIVGQAISPIIGGIIADSFSILNVFLLIPFYLFIPLIHLYLLRNIMQRDFLLTTQKSN